MVDLESMDGIETAGAVLAIDHDRLFKELLTTFFVEFLELSFPKLAASLERDSNRISSAGAFCKCSRRRRISS